MRIHELVSKILDQALDDVHTALPAKVERFDPTTLRGEVLPLIKRQVTKDGELEPLPPILDVPFWMPKAGPFVLRLPVRRGDVVLLVFSERALDYILTDGRPQDPQFRRRHALDDAIAIPGLLYRSEGTLPGDHAGDVALFDRATGNKIVLKASGDCVIHVPAGRIYLADEGADEAAARGTSLKEWLDNHQHPYSWTPGAGSDTTGPPTEPSPEPRKKVFLK
mgnify:CR=1 FL=1